MINFIIHWLLIPVKVVAMTLLAAWHRLYLKQKYPYVVYYREPNYHSLENDYIKLLDMVKTQLSPGPTGKLLFQVNPDHQALRQGSLAWSTQDPYVIEGMENFIVNGEFIRGIGTPYTAPPAMPMSVAHAIMCHWKVSDDLKTKFVEAVDKEITTSFEQEGDTSVRPRAKSTGFDAIYALSLLYTAFSLTGDSKYVKEANSILWKKGYVFLLLAPLTYLSENRRNMHIDHIALFGLRAAIIGCPSALIQRLLCHAFKFIHSQSYCYGNPYFAAMAYEVGCLPERHRDMVLDLHNKVDVMRASRHREVIYGTQYPSDYSTHTADEFLFDDYKPGGIASSEATLKQVPLNGLCLAASLLMLEKE